MYSFLELNGRRHHQDDRRRNSDVTIRWTQANEVADVWAKVANARD